MSSTRYTLSLPDQIYEELRIKADKHGTSIKEVVRQCLKVGLIAIEVNENPSTDLLIRERSSNGDSSEVKETLVQFLW